MDPDELKKFKSDYIPPENPLSQSYSLQDAQRKLFKECLPKNQIVDKTVAPNPETEFPQALPVVKRESSTYYYRGYVPGVKNIILDNTKIKRKIPIPRTNGFNYAGIIIGPRGANQKRLEEETGCKILVRGRGSQKEGQPAQPDDWEPLHVLIAGDTEEQVEIGVQEIEKILYSDEQSRNMIRQIQLKEVAKIRSSDFAGAGNNLNYDFRFAGCGVPNPNAFVVQIPNEAVGLVLGIGGETLREIQVRSEAFNLQLAPDSAPGSDFRTLFVEGSEDAFLRVKKMVDEIVGTQTKMRIALTNTDSTDTLLNVQISIPVLSLPYIVGKDAEILAKISEKTGANLVFSLHQNLESVRRTILCSGTTGQIIKAKHEIDLILAERFKGEVSTLSYTNKALKSEAEEDKEAKDKKGLFEGEIKDDHDKLTITDKGTNYYSQLREYFGLGLDFLGDPKSSSVVQVTDYYPDGTINVYYYS